MINNLMEGIFTPINFSEPRFETKVENLEDVAEQKTDKSKSKETKAKKIKQINGRKGRDPTRYGDWEKNGRCIDF